MGPSQILAGPWMGCVGCVTLDRPRWTDRGFCNVKVISTRGAPKALHNGIYCDCFTTDCSELLLSQTPGEPGSMPGVGEPSGTSRIRASSSSIPPASLGSLRAWVTDLGSLHELVLSSICYHPNSSGFSYFLWFPCPFP